MRKGVIKEAGLIAAVGLLSLTHCAGMIEEARFLLNPESYFVQGPNDSRSYSAESKDLSYRHED